MRFRGISGFSLAELAVVLVIAALLVIGGATGVEVNKQADYRRILMDVEQYRTYAQYFTDKYIAYPGDMPGAADLWADTDCVDARTTNEDNNNCNGNGDSHVTASNGEGLKFWLHLYKEGLLTTGYIGKRVSSIYEIGLSVPETTLNAKGFYVDYSNAGNSSLKAFNGFGFISNDGTRTLLQEIAYNLDKKSDDGLPASGRVLASPNCQSGSTYDFSDDDLLCDEFHISSD